MSPTCLRSLESKMESDKIEQTLYQCREVQLYRIPPRPSSGADASSTLHVLTLDHYRWG